MARPPASIRYLGAVDSQRLSHVRLAKTLVHIRLGAPYVHQVPTTRLRPRVPRNDVRWGSLLVVELSGCQVVSSGLMLLV